MKAIILFLVVAFVCPVYALDVALMSKLHPSQFSIRVLDEGGMPVPDARIQCEFYMYEQGFGSDLRLHQEVESVTDTNGVTVLTGDSVGHIYFSIKKDGMYSSMGKHQVTNIINGRFEPWDIVYEFRLRAIQNPIPMYAKHAMDTFFPDRNANFFYDFMVGDWVAPYGAGKNNDILLRLNYTELGNDRHGSYYDAHLVFSFPNDEDGVQPILETNDFRGSVFQLPRYAPLSGWQKEHSIRIWRTLGNVEGVPKGVGISREQDQNLFFRVRTQIDGNGNVISALYGKIHAPIQVAAMGVNKGQLSFIYYLNPTPNDRNMEFDPTRNLLKGKIASWEEVLEP